MKLTSVVENNEPKRRDRSPASELRELEKLVQAFAEEFSFAREEVDRLKKKTASAIAAWHMAEGRHRQEHHQTRARLNTLFNGRIERWIYASDDEDMKTFFRRVWRDDPNTARKETSKQPPDACTSPATAAVKSPAQGPQSKEKQAL